MIQSTNDKNTEEITITEDRQNLEKLFRSGANWFYWISGLSLINTFLFISGSDWGFIAGLAITMIIDGIASELPAVGIVIALVFDALFAGSFIAFGYFAGKGHKWAFITGIVLYGLDTLLIFALGMMMAQSGEGSDVLISLVFHGLALYFIFNGFRALKKLKLIEITLETKSEDHSGEQL